MTGIIDHRDADATYVDLEIVIEAPADTVFEFLVVPEKVMRWMGPETEVEADGTPGGAFRFRYPNGDAAAGTYGDIDRPRLVTMHWGWEGNDAIAPGTTLVEFELTELDGRTTVHLRHTGLPDAAAAAEHTEGWCYYGGRMAVAVEGGDPDGADVHQPQAAEEAP